MQISVSSDSIGHMHVNTGIAPWIWEACTPKLKECAPFARGREVDTVGAAAGTVFRVKDGRGESGRTPEWRGSPQELAPPRVAGIIAANEFVSPVRGLWSGGWEGENSELQLSACATEAGGGCVRLTDPHYVRWGCTSSNSLLLGPDLTGRYLRVTNRQSGGPHVETPFAVGPPPPRYEAARLRSGAEVWGRSRNTSVAIVGQIAPAAHPPAGECGPPPAPTATISAKGVARVECGGGCSVVLVGTRKGRRQLVTRRIREQDLLRPEPALEVGLPRAALARLGAGKIRLTAEIDGARWAQRTIRTSDS
jgi:hypothetical protein